MPNSRAIVRCAHGAQEQLEHVGSSDVWHVHEMVITNIYGVACKG